MIALPCPECGGIWTIAGRIERGDARCPHCGRIVFLAGGSANTATAPNRCLICGSDFLYWQKDFNRSLGCALVALGAVFVPWTYGISVAVMALADFILYQVLPKVSVCYICKARYRGISPHPDHAPFDLMTAQTYEARAANWAAGKIPPIASSPLEPRAGMSAGVDPPR